jgi:hypothetical protein
MLSNDLPPYLLSTIYCVVLAKLLLRYTPSAWPKGCLHRRPAGWRNCFRRFYSICIFWFVYASLALSASYSNYRWSIYMQEKLTMNADNRKLLWSASEKALKDWLPVGSSRLWACLLRTNAQIVAICDTADLSFHVIPCFSNERVQHNKEGVDVSLYLAVKLQCTSFNQSKMFDPPPPTQTPAQHA